MMLARVLKPDRSWESRVGSIIQIGMLAAVAATYSGCPHHKHVELFNGDDLTGWFISTTTGHGDTMGWSVQDGHIEGMQDSPGNGGVLLTDATFGDFYVQADVMPDEGMDSGLFLRSTESGAAYQITIDLVENGTIGCVFGEGLDTGFLFRNDDWRDAYRPDDWNTIGASIQGNPPRINVWINGKHMVSWEDTEVRLPNTGHIGLQVHGGEVFDGFKMRARHVFIKPLQHRVGSLCHDSTIADGG